MRWSGITSASMGSGYTNYSSLQAGYFAKPASAFESFYFCAQYRWMGLQRATLGISFQHINPAGIPSFAIEGFGKYRGHIARKVRYELSTSLGRAEKNYFSLLEQPANNALVQNPKHLFMRGGICVSTWNFLIGYLYRTGIGKQETSRSHTLRAAGNLSFKKYSPWSFTPGILMEWNNDPAYARLFMLQSGLLVHYKNFHAGPLFQTSKNDASMIGARFGYLSKSWQIRTTAAFQNSAWQMDIDLLYSLNFHFRCTRFLNLTPNSYF